MKFNISNPLNKILLRFTGCVRYIFASLFFKSKGEKQGEIFFISLPKLFSFSRKSDFRILDIQIL